MTDQKAGETLANTVDTTVTVRRSVSQSPKSVWRFLVTREGAETLLGPGGELGDKGDSWHAEDGTYGVIRSYHPLEQIRFSWHAAEEAPKTIVDVQLLPGDEGETTVQIRHEQIPAYFDAAALSRRWERALEKLADATDLATVSG